MKVFNIHSIHLKVKKLKEKCFRENAKCREICLIENNVLT